MKFVFQRDTWWLYMTWKECDKNARILCSVERMLNVKMNYCDSRRNFSDMSQVWETNVKRSAVHVYCDSRRNFGDIFQLSETKVKRSAVLVWLLNLYYLSCINAMHSRYFLWSLNSFFQTPDYFDFHFKICFMFIVIDRSNLNGF